MADTRDDLTKQYFNGEVSISGRFDPIQLSGGVLDRDLSDVLLGAPDGSRVYVKRTKSGIEFEAINSSLFSAQREMLLAKDGVLHWIGFFLRNDAPDGLGTRIAAISLLTASRLGIPRIELAAWGPPNHNGHYTWARLGFDASFEKKELEVLNREGFAYVKTVLDLIETERGRDWWKRNGWTKEMAFDLDSNSVSMQTLKNYLSLKGVKL